MGMLRDLLRKIIDFIADREEQPASGTGPGIKALAEKPIQALQGRFEMLATLVQVASQRRRDLQKQVEKAQALEAGGKQALAQGDLSAAETAMARYAEMQQAIQLLVLQARKADEQATAAMIRFEADIQAARQAAFEADMLAPLEEIMVLQKKDQALEHSLSFIMNEFEAAREKLLLNAATQAAVMRLENESDTLYTTEINLEQRRNAHRTIGERWTRETTEAGGQSPEGIQSAAAGDDPTADAIRFLIEPPFGGRLSVGSRQNQKQ